MRATSDDKVEKMTSDGLQLYIGAFSGSKPARLRAWRGMLAKRDILSKLEKVAELAKRKKLIEKELGEQLYKAAEEVMEMVNTWDLRSGEESVMNATDAEGQHWYEVAVDGINGTAHEALARFCETVYQCEPAKK